ncbi:MAG: hypothetical protein KME26_05945 [Oscillatoria princeps RMCB-10]|nr:hypothetical protein [Oscillatoria princeps RMCB-10]
MIKIISGFAEKQNIFSGERRSACGRQPRHLSRCRRRGSSARKVSVGSQSAAPARCRRLSLALPCSWQCQKLNRAILSQIPDRWD